MRAPAAHRALALNLLAAGTPRISISDDLDETTALLDARAAGGAPRRAGGGGRRLRPGLSCLLARHAGNLFDEVDEVHVCRAGTGSACARQHRAALTGAAVDWRDGEWVRRRGGSVANWPTSRADRAP